MNLKKMTVAKPWATPFYLWVKFKILDLYLNILRLTENQEKGGRHA
jgi:hypothetical protein